MSLVLFAVLVAFIELWYVNSTASSTIDDIGRITELVKLNEKDKALENSEKVIKEWDESSKFFDIFLLHEEIEIVSENLEEINEAIKNDDKNRFFEVYAKTRKRLEIIKEDEFPLLENVL